MPELVLDDTMLERAAKVFDNLCHDPRFQTDSRAREVAEQIIRAAFEGVPMANFAIGTLLQHFDLVICTKGYAAGVYRSDDPAEGFDSLAHTLTIHGSPSQPKAITIGKIGQEDVDG